MIAVPSVPVLELRGISKKFPGVRALQEVDFDLHRGEVHALIGENGAGKSTLIRILSGVYRPDEGAVLLEKRPVVIHSPIHAQRLGIATLHQEFTLVPHLSVAENIFLGAMPRKHTHSFAVDAGEMHRRSLDILRMLGAAIDTYRNVDELRMVERKLVEIARALRKNARVMIMDEPTAALSAEEVDTLHAIIRRLRSDGVGVIYITHHLQEVRRIADRVTVLRDGRHVSTLSVSHTSYEQLIRLMIGQTVDNFFPERSHEPGPVVLQVRDLTRNGVFTDVRFEVRAGEIVGIGGLVGSGRSEVLRAICGADPYSSGDVLVFGRLVQFRSPRAAVRAGFTLLPADRKREALVLPMSAKSNITLSGLKRFSRILLRLRYEVERAVALIRQLSIRTPSIDTHVKYLSGGNQQKILIARAVCFEAKVLLLDEPTAGVDVGTKAEIYRLLEGLARQGAAIVISSSDLAELVGISDRIIVMRGGSITAKFRKGEATEEKILRRALGIEEDRDLSQVCPKADIS